MPYQGMQVTFSPAYPFVTNTTATPSPLVIATTPRRFVTDSEGYLSDPVDGFDLDGKGNNRNCQIIASDDPDITPTNWKYLVTFTGPGATHFRAFRTPAPANAVVDMAVLTPQNISTGTAPTQAEIAAANAAASAAAAQASVASIHRGQAGGVAPLDPDGDVNDAFGNKILADGGAAVVNPNTLLSKITDMSPYARLLNTDTSATAARSRLGAGTSNLVIGTTAGTAADAAATTTALNLRALNTGVVHTTGDETVAGIKQFTSPPTIPSATADDNPVTRAQLTAAIAGTGADADVVHKSGTETITGAKTYSISPTVPTATAAGHPVTKATYDVLATTVGGHTTSLTAALARITALETALGNPTTPIETTQNLYWDTVTSTYKDVNGAPYNSSATHHNWYYGPSPQLLTPPITLQPGDTWTEAVVTPPATVTSITINGQTHVINGTDVVRGASQMIRYTYSTAQTVTPTNQFGVEVTVNLATMKVTAVNNRIVAGSTVGTPITNGNVVISGHGGPGAEEPGQWLLANATVGAAVTFGTGTVVDPTPTPPPVSTPGSGLAPKVVSVWHHRWSGPNLRDYPSDVKSLVNSVSCGLAQSAGSGTGSLTYSPANGQSVADHATDIRAFVAAGKTVLLGFGGSSDGGITITSDATADQAYNSIVSLVNTYGFNGIDIDLEPSGSNWTQSALLRLCQKLKTQFGTGFVVGCTVGLYDVWTARWTQFMVAAGANADFLAPMLYDFPEAGDSRLSAVAVQKCDAMAAAGVPQSKMILGFMMRPNAGYTNATPTVQLCTDAWNAVKAKYPNVRGGFVWEDLISVARNWDWVRGTGAAIAATAPVSTGTITSFTATATSGTTLVLNWAYSGAALSGWSLSRTGGTGGPLVTPVTAAARTYTDTTLVAGTTYTYTLTGTFTAGGTTSATAAGTTTSSTPPATGTWIKGAAGPEAANGSFGTWRGTPVQLGKTWSDGTPSDMTELWALQAGLEWGSFTGSVDMSPGMIWKSSGESWANAATGSYDARWTACLNRAKTEWTRIPRSGTLYLSPAVEWNGGWSDWNVQASELTNFKTAWARFYNLKQAIFPACKFVFCTNGDTASLSPLYDWRNGWPGDAFVDVYGTDWYSFQWTDGRTVDSFGAPVGLEQHRQFALAHGKPFAVPEWGVANNDTGDVPNYITYMYNFFAANGGTGAGNLLYEAYFNVHWTPDNFGIFPRAQSLSPNSSDRYAALY